MMTGLCLLAFCGVWAVDIGLQTTQAFFEGSMLVPREQRRSVSRFEFRAWVCACLVSVGLLLFTTSTL